MPISQFENIFGIDYIRSRIQAKYNHMGEKNIEKTHGASQPKQEKYFVYIFCVTLTGYF